MTPIEDLCKGMPEEFMEFVKYSRELQFTDTPKYNNIIGLFEQAKKQAGFDSSTNIFCWTKMLEKEKKEELAEIEKDRAQTAKKDKAGL